MTRTPRTPRGVTCPRCGQIHPGCTAHNNRGTPCGKGPLPGLTVCTHHGGNAPAARAAGQRRVAQQAAEAALLEGIADAPPLRSLREVYDELLATGGQISDARQKLAAHVGNLDALDHDGPQGEQTRANVALFERFLDRSMKFAELIIRLNIDERRQALNERDGQAVATVLRRALDRLNPTPEQRAAAPAIFAEEIHALTAPKETA